MATVLPIAAPGLNALDLIKMNTPAAAKPTVAKGAAAKSAAPSTSKKR